MRRHQKEKRTQINLLRKRKDEISNVGGKFIISTVVGHDNEN